MELKGIMDAFAAETGLSNLTADENGVYTLGIDEMIVSFVEDAEAGRIVTFAEVGKPPAEGCERFYRLLLETMYRGTATGGATFCMDPDSGAICLQRSDALATADLDSFKAALETFVNILEDWRQSIADFGDISSAIDAAKNDAAAETRQFGLNADGFIQV